MNPAQPSHIARALSRAGTFRAIEEIYASSSSSISTGSNPTPKSGETKEMNNSKLDILMSVFGKEALEPQLEGRAILVDSAKTQANAASAATRILRTAKRRRIPSLRAIQSMQEEKKKKNISTTCSLISSMKEKTKKRRRLVEASYRKEFLQSLNDEWMKYASNLLNDKLKSNAKTSASMR